MVSFVVHEVAKFRTKKSSLLSFLEEAEIQGELWWTSSTKFHPKHKIQEGGLPLKVLGGVLELSSFPYSR